jgi:ADP-ribose pyrophosphatase YjhB (NUDIX family)
MNAVMPSNPAKFQALRAQMGYPDVPLPDPRQWDMLHNGYRPAYYTAPKVQQNVPNWNKPDAAKILGRIMRYDNSTVFIDPETQQPRNPAGATGIRGLGRLWNYGPNFSADGVAVSGGSLLLVRRRDTGQLAFPGGFRNEADDYLEGGIEAALREIHEETDLDMSQDLLDIIEESDSIAELSLRNTDDAWITCARYILQLPDDYHLQHRPKAPRDSDASEALWLPVGAIDLDDLSDAHRLAMPAVREACAI